MKKIIFILMLFFPISVLAFSINNIEIKDKNYNNSNYNENVLVVNGRVTIDKSKITKSGDGELVTNAAILSNSANLNISNSSIISTGNNSTGVYLNNSNSNISNSVITSSGLKSNGILINGGSLKLSNTKISTLKSASLLSINAELHVNNSELNSINSNSSNININNSKIDNILLRGNNDNNMDITNSNFSFNDYIIKVDSTKSVIYLKNNTINSSKIIKANNSNLSIELEQQNINGNIDIENSSLYLNIDNNSKFNGIISGDNINVAISSSSKWILTDDCYISKLENSNNSNSNIYLNGHKLYVDGVLLNANEKYYETNDSSSNNKKFNLNIVPFIIFIGIVSIIFIFSLFIGISKGNKENRF